MEDNEHFGGKEGNRCEKNDIIIIVISQAIILALKKTLLNFHSALSETVSWFTENEPGVTELQAIAEWLLHYCLHYKLTLFNKMQNE